MDIIEALNWRYATKAMNGEKVNEEKINTILEAIRLAPTSSGLQPFEVLVISDPEMKAKISPIANNQPVVTQSSHLLVFAAWDDYTEKRINDFFDIVHAERGFLEGADNYRKRLVESYVGRNREKNFEHAAHQAYIAFGVGLLAAAESEVDSTPIEGFNSDELDRFLKLRERGLRSITLLALGYRDIEKDWLLPLKKVRKPKQDLIVEFS